MQRSSRWLGQGVDETGDRKRGRGIVLAGQQYIGKVSHTANGDGRWAGRIADL